MEHSEFTVVTAVCRAFVAPPDLFRDELAIELKSPPIML